MGIRLNGTSWLIACVAVAGIAFVAERLLEPGVGGSLLITMAVFLGLAEGATVLMAGAEISDGHWHRPLLPRVAALHTIIPAVALLFVVNIPQTTMYPWAAHEGAWLNRNFFVARHLVLMLLAFAIARKFVTDAMRGARSSRFWGVILVIVFMAQLSMVGIEWFMSIEQPWFSTLFGAFVAVSAFLAGICTCALILLGWRKRTDAPAKLVQKSIGGLMFGFATFWAYFYFSQLIVIWYGNIPEETMYLAKRIGYHTPYWLAARLIFTMVWGIPFAVLLSRKNKTRPFVTSALALCVLSGITLMFWLMLVPVVPVSIPLLLIEMGLMAFLTASVVRSYDALLRVPAEAAEGRLAMETHGGA
jgi:hypothetical protein